MLLRQWLLATAQETGVSRQPANKISLPKLDSASPLVIVPAIQIFMARARYPVCPRSAGGNERAKHGELKPLSG